MRLPFKPALLITSPEPFFGNKFCRGVVIFVTEIDALLALFSDRHGSDNGIELARQQRRNHTVPVLLDKHTFALKFGTDRFSDFNIETLQRAVGLFP